LLVAAVSYIWPVDVHEFFPQRRNEPKKKLPAAPCSMKGCAEAVPVIAEQDKADLGADFVRPDLAACKSKSTKSVNH
jgi:hypothetical protein